MPTDWLKTPPSWVVDGFRSAEVTMPAGVKLVDGPAPGVYAMHRPDGVSYSEFRGFAIVRSGSAWPYMRSTSCDVFSLSRSEQCSDYMCATIMWKISDRDSDFTSEEKSATTVADRIRRIAMRGLASFTNDAARILKDLYIHSCPLRADQVLGWIQGGTEVDWMPCVARKTGAWAWGRYNGVIDAPTRLTMPQLREAALRHYLYLLRYKNRNPLEAWRGSPQGPPSSAPTPPSKACDEDYSTGTRFPDELPVAGMTMNYIARALHPNTRVYADERMWLRGDPPYVVGYVTSSDQSRLWRGIAMSLLRKYAISAHVPACMPLVTTTISFDDALKLK